MAQVTSGRVAYSRTVQPAQYESKRAEAELAFVVEDGEDPAAVVREIGAMVRAECLALVGLHPGPKVSHKRARE